MEDRMAKREFLGVIFRQDLLKLCLHIFPLILPPKVVEEDEAAAHDVFAESCCLLIGQFHKAGFDDVKEGIIKKPLIHDLESFRTWRNFQVSSSPLSQTNN